MDDATWLLTVGMLVALVVLVARILTMSHGDGVVKLRKKKEMGEFTREQVAQHNTRDDLWLILTLDGVAGVYDVTSYVDEHPGGDAILQNAGADSTALFVGPQHPPRVHDLIEEFRIGNLVD